MTAGPREGDAYYEPGAYQAAVEALHDPLNDPLPGQASGPGGQGDGHDEAYDEAYYAHLAPEAGAQRPDPETVGLRRPRDLGAPPPATGGRAARRRAAQARAAAQAAAQGYDETRELTGEAVPAAVPPPTGGRAARRRAAQGKPSQERASGAHAAEAAPPEGGRAARRRAAQGKGGGRRPAAPTPAAAPPTAADELSGGRAARRKAAKTAARAARQTGTAISNVIGELFITTGALLLLFVVYQLWWTNVEARAHANGEADRLTEQWDDSGGDDGGSRDPGAFSAGQGFAILYIPTLDVRVPVAETVDPATVLDNGMVGHYSEADRLPTAMPWEEEGNFGIAGHRNTHGEPFRYINQLDPGDPIVIETADAFYTYEMTSRLDETSPSNTEVLDPVPEQGGFTEPGRYITLTTCTPEFTSTYRLIVWGQMIEERPRSEGKPDALVD
ncbi:class E sortase [Streptomyces sp. PT12]|uniref:class E sortase n=1 Tax=Streptomyces sp. PT12 TaxID=1510197 RepID=UPI00215C6404|nr:class E sortase [Streptomyces sp. PT12]